MIQRWQHSSNETIADTTALFSDSVLSLDVSISSPKIAKIIIILLHVTTVKQKYLTAVTPCAIIPIEQVGI